MSQCCLQVKNVESWQKIIPEAFLSQKLLAACPRSSAAECTEWPLTNSKSTVNFVSESQTRTMVAHTTDRLALLLCFDRLQVLSRKMDKGDGKRIRHTPSGCLLACDSQALASEYCDGIRRHREVAADGGRCRTDELLNTNALASGISGRSSGVDGYAGICGW